MAVIRADNQMILAGVLRNVFDVLVRFTGDKNSILAEHVFVRREFPFLAEESFNNMHHERHPTGRRFDKTEFQPRKLLRNLIVDQVAKGEQRLHPAVTEGMVSLNVEKIQEQGTAGAGV